MFIPLTQIGNSLPAIMMGAPAGVGDRKAGDTGAVRPGARIRGPSKKVITRPKSDEFTPAIKENIH